MAVETVWTSSLHLFKSNFSQKCLRPDEDPCMLSYKMLNFFDISLALFLQNVNEVTNFFWERSSLLPYRRKSSHVYFLVELKTGCYRVHGLLFQLCTKLGSLTNEQNPLNKIIVLIPNFYIVSVCL